MTVGAATAALQHWLVTSVREWRAQIEELLLGVTPAPHAQQLGVDAVEVLRPQPGDVQGIEPTAVRVQGSGADGDGEAGAALRPPQAHPPADVTDSDGQR